MGAVGARQRPAEGIVGHAGRSGGALSRNRRDRGAQQLSRCVVVVCGHRAVHGGARDDLVICVVRGRADLASGRAAEQAHQGRHAFRSGEGGLLAGGQGHGVTRRRRGVRGLVIPHRGEVAVCIHLRYDPAVAVVIGAHDLIVRTGRERVPLQRGQRRRTIQCAALGWAQGDRVRGGSRRSIGTVVLDNRHEAGRIHRRRHPPIGVIERVAGTILRVGMKRRLQCRPSGCIAQSRQLCGRQRRRKRRRRDGPALAVIPRGDDVTLGIDRGQYASGGVHYHALDMVVGTGRRHRQAGGETGGERATADPARSADRGRILGGADDVPSSIVGNGADGARRVHRASNATVGIVEGVTGVASRIDGGHLTTGRVIEVGGDATGLTAGRLRAAEQPPGAVVGLRGGQSVGLDDRQRAVAVGVDVAGGLVQRIGAADQAPQTVVGVAGDLGGGVAGPAFCRALQQLAPHVVDEGADHRARVEHAGTGAVDGRPLGLCGQLAPHIVCVVGTRALPQGGLERRTGYPRLPLGQRRGGVRARPSQIERGH